ncbi:MAG: hypothetical protein JWQ73_1718 [Variovorax sp.]|nr:hypothetical protein [Variovorax sp.]
MTFSDSISGSALRGLKAVSISAVLLLSLAIAGCASTEPAPTTAAQRVDQAVAQVTDALVAQTQSLPDMLGVAVGRRGVVLDPMIDANSGQQTASTQLLQTRVVDRIRTKHTSLELLPFQRANLDKASYLLTGTLTHQRQIGKSRGALQINLALTDLRSGNVVAQSSAMARDDELDNTPLAFEQDSPVLPKDRLIEGYARTAVTPAGQPADPFYIQRLPVAPVVSEAGASYNAGRYQEALAQYNEANASPVGEQLRVLSGIYLASVKLDRPAEADKAFGKIVAFGIANKQLGVKFLFNPGTTVFWSDPKVSGPYGLWLARIAQVSTQANVCMDIVGHTSRTGAEALNDALSLQRASYIRQRLTGVSPVFGERTRAAGKGYRENIIGSGTDNAVDALDRRVEFKIVGCDRAG